MSSTTSASPATASVNLADESPYGYIPTAWICIMFIALFGVSTIAHAGQAIKWRMWWLFPTAVLAGTGEIIGWSGRYWSYRNILSDGFLMQITTTIISPTPLLAANFIILGKVIAVLGPQYSRLPPRLYSRVFLSCDLISLVVQAAGGALASTAKDKAGSDMGGKIMLGGIAFQLVAITAYVFFATEFFTRLFTQRPLRDASQSSDIEIASGRTTEDSQGSLVGYSSSVLNEKRSNGVQISGHMKLMIAGLTFSTVVIFIRSVYRTIELSDGWDGRIIQTQVYFNVLDGAMIVLAMYCLNFLHPGYLLRA